MLFACDWTNCNHPVLTYPCRTGVTVRKRQAWTIIVYKVICKHAVISLEWREGSHSWFPPLSQRSHPCTLQPSRGQWIMKSLIKITSLTGYQDELLTHWVNFGRDSFQLHSQAEMHFFFTRNCIVLKLYSDLYTNVLLMKYSRVFRFPFFEEWGYMFKIAIQNLGHLAVKGRESISCKTCLKQE